jgi:hypothetical protein
MSCMMFTVPGVATIIRARPYVVVSQRGYLSSSKSIETLISVADERQAHLGRDVISLLCSLSTQSGAGVVLINLVDREVLRIDVGLQLRLERCTDATQTVPLHTTEKGMLSDFTGAADSTKTVLGITDQARAVSVWRARMTTPEQLTA